MGLRNWIAAVTGWLKRALAAASANGLTDELVRDAYWLAKKAAETIDDPTDQADAKRRAFVIAQFTSRGIPESIARFALEAAVQILKREKVAP
jgi:hypothetical protein